MISVLRALVLILIIAVAASAEVRAKTVAGVATNGSGIVVPNAEVTLHLCDSGTRESKMSHLPTRQDIRKRLVNRASILAPEAA